MPQIKNFETLCGALAVQKQVNSSLLEVMQDPRQRNSLKVLHDTPEVWRMWLQLGEVRVNLHTIFTCEDPFMHFHPRNSIVQVIR
ncbi:hypothetical protein KA037_04680 [Patescibacteria group bacterium]|nr:hypothetical protein [Patescibacteria group bacterium]